MFKKPEKPEEVFKEFSSDIESIFGSNLLSINLYGSGARGEYVQGKSDINFLVIIKSEGLKFLSGVWDRINQWEKKGISTPLILTNSYVSSSLDTFPLEFLNMKEANVPVFGEDLLTGLDINENDLRIQIERELKSNLLNLRQGFMKTKGDRYELTGLISTSLPTFTAIFKGTLSLMENETSGIKSSELYQNIESLFKLRSGLFQNLLDVKLSVGKRTTSELIGLMEEYMAAIRTIFKHVDKLEH